MPKKQESLFVENLICTNHEISSMSYDLERWELLEEKRRQEAVEYRKMADAEKAKIDAIKGTSSKSERRKNALSRTWLRLLSLSMRSTFQADKLHELYWQDVFSDKLATIEENLEGAKA